jgi:hypothetical protein
MEMHGPDIARSGQTRIKFYRVPVENFFTTPRCHIPDVGGA